MADEEPLRILRQGVDTWNAWRKQAGYGRPRSGLDPRFWQNELVEFINEISESMPGDRGSAPTC